MQDVHERIQAGAGGNSRTGVCVVHKAHLNGLRNAHLKSSSEEIFPIFTFNLARRQDIDVGGVA
jgi:hypothetical protein